MEEGIVTERNQLRDHVEQLEEQLAYQCPGREVGVLITTCGLSAAEENGAGLDVSGAGGEVETHVSDCGEQSPQEREDPSAHFT